MKLIFQCRQALVGDVETFAFSSAVPVIWLPGQYIHYTLPQEAPDERGEERWFTISSAPFEAEIRITTRIFDRPSTFKQRLMTLKPGDEVEVDPPEGDFVLGDDSRQYIFVAGGIGITPFRAIIKALDHDGKNIKIDLLYANRNDTDIVFQAELEEIASRHDDFNIRYFVGDTRIDGETLDACKSAYHDPYFYISGPEPMVESFKAMLSELGVSKDHRQLDFFPGYVAE